MGSLGGRTLVSAAFAGEQFAGRMDYRVHSDFEHSFVGLRVPRM
jgi:hypothetical protein